MVRTFERDLGLKNTPIEVWGAQKAARRKEKSKADKRCTWALGWAISINEAYVMSMQCTYMEEVCAMLPIRACWVEAFSTATPTKALDGRTCYEMMFNTKLDLTDLHVFGVLCAIVRLSKKLKKPHRPRSDCGLGYEHQWGACNIRAMHVHRWIGLEQGGRKYLMYCWGGRVSAQQVFE